MVSTYFCHASEAGDVSVVSVAFLMELVVAPWLRVRTLSRASGGTGTRTSFCCAAALPHSFSAGSSPFSLSNTATKLSSSSSSTVRAADEQSVATLAGVIVLFANVIAGKTPADARSRASTSVGSAVLLLSGFREACIVGLFINSLKSSRTFDIVQDFCLSRRAFRFLRGTRFRLRVHC